MHGFSKIYERAVLGNPIVVIVLLALVLAFFSYHAKDFTLEASTETLLLEHDKDLLLYREVNKRYDLKDYVFVTFTPHGDLFSRKSLYLLRALSSYLKAMDRVGAVWSIFDIPLLRSAGLTLAEITPESVRYLGDAGIDAESAKAELLENPIARNLFLDDAGKTAMLVVMLESNLVYSEVQEERDRLIAKSRAGELDPEEGPLLEKARADYEAYMATLNRNLHEDIGTMRSLLGLFEKQAEVHLCGVPMIVEDMTAFIKDDLAIFGLGVFVFIVATLTVIFRKVRWVVMPLLSCFFSVTLMIGILGFLDWEVTVISSNFISLMLILTMSMNIHLIIRYRQLCADLPSADQAETVSAALRKMVWPCLYTALTTILAFSSLVFSGIKPVIDFGWMMTIGLSVTFATSFLLFPAILVLQKKSEPAVTGGTRFAFTSMLASVAQFHGRKVILFAFLFAGISVAGIANLRVENSFINYFSEKTEIYRGMKLIDDRLSGTSPLDIILRFGEPQQISDADDVLSETGDEDFFEEDDFGWSEDESPEDYWFTPYKVKRIKQVHDYFDSLPEIGKVLSLASVIRMVEQLNDGKDIDALELSLLYKRIPDELKSEWIDSFVSFDHNEARISVYILDSLKDLRRKELLERIRADLSRRFGYSEDEAAVTGVLVLYNNMLQSLFRSQILTLGIVLLGIGIMLLVFFRTILLAIVGIIPNLLAVTTVLGIMGLLEIPLDLMTITIAAITMGIAIDNSIHYIYRFREEFAKNGNYGETLRVCHGNVGRAILNTSTTIIFGFSILVFSNFLPTIYFGLFTGLAMFVALMAILTLLPRIILLWKPFGPDRGE